MSNIHNVALFAVSVFAVGSLWACGGATEPLSDLCGSGTVFDDGDCYTLCDTPDDCVPGEWCVEGACRQVESICSNGFVEPLEQCDDGNLVDGDGCDRHCALEGPAGGCAYTDSCTFAQSGWDDWSGCAGLCDDTLESRTRECIRSDSVIVDCSGCGGGCTETRTCAEAPLCRFDFQPWSDWSVCVDDAQVRTRECRRGDGEAASCSDCDGECLEERSCVVCSMLSVNIADGRGEQTCNELLAVRRQACLDAGCISSAPVGCTYGGSPSSDTVWGVLAVCE